MERVRRANREVKHRPSDRAYEGTDGPDASCWSGTMTTKEKALHALKELPDDASIEDAMERLLFLAKVEKGLRQAEAGQTVPHAEVKDRMAKRLR